MRSRERERRKPGPWRIRKSTHKRIARAVISVCPDLKSLRAIGFVGASTGHPERGQLGVQVNRRGGHLPLLLLQRRMQKQVGLAKINLATRFSNQPLAIGIQPLSNALVPLINALMPRPTGSGPAVPSWLATVARCRQDVARGHFRAPMPSPCHSPPSSPTPRVASQLGHTLTLNRAFQKYLRRIHRRASGGIILYNPRGCSDVPRKAE